ncbi:MAG: acyl carrier protein [Deltaproteobacteria bacterium]|nr:acyl carrier protein [Deltaproteobacteria bacterium]
MDIFGNIKKILGELLDIEEKEIMPETYIVRDLGAESIDFLELAVALNSRFKIEIDDDEIFLRKLRVYLTEAEQEKRDVLLYLAGKFPFLSEERIKEITADLDGGPVLKVKDLISYVFWRCK